MIFEIFSALHFFKQTEAISLHPLLKKPSNGHVAELVDALL